LVLGAGATGGIGSTGFAICVAGGGGRLIKRASA
jgi:hypothetical protein